VIRRRQAMTLIETLFAFVIGVGLLYVVQQLTLSGSRLFHRGVEAARGPEAALLLLDRLEEDLTQALQAPGDPRPPARVDRDGTRILYYRPARELSRPASLVGAPASWSLAPSPADPDLSVPVRDGVPLEGIELVGWSFELLEPDAGERRLGWYVVFEARFPTTSSGRPFVLRRLLHLPQPSSNFLHFLSHGDALLPGTVTMLPPPPEEPAFRGLGPPEVRP